LTNVGYAPVATKFRAAANWRDVPQTDVSRPIPWQILQLINSRSAYPEFVGHKPLHYVQDLKQELG
jgi:hypothetical protein